MHNPKANQIAPAGQIWVCLACGKMAKDRYTDERSWDESCMLNSMLCWEDKLIIQGSLVSFVPDDAEVK